MNEAEYYFIDSHTHLYSSQFDVDRVEVMQRCLDNNVRKLVMPNEDYLSIAPLKSMLNNNKGICYGAMGLHPTSVNDGYKHEMELIGEELFNGDTGYVAVGEIGMDLYWDKTYTIDQKRTLQALGLRKISQIVEVEDTPSIRGMIKKVHHLVTVVE